MTAQTVLPMLTVITARGGSKGLPGKNVRDLAGLPLIAHSILFAKLCPEIECCIVSTDDIGIAGLAREYRAEVPFLRPAELAQDDTPSLAVVQHAVKEMEARDGRRFESVLLLQPTSPARSPEDVKSAVELLNKDAEAAGVIAVSAPEFNPRYVCVEEKNGYASAAFPCETRHSRRQDVPVVYRINGLLYLWRRDFVLQAAAATLFEAPHRMLVTPRERAIDIDDLHDFQLAELAVREGLVSLPWLNAKVGRR